MGSACRLLAASLGTVALFGCSPRSGTRSPPRAAPAWAHTLPIPDDYSFIEADLPALRRQKQKKQLDELLEMQRGKATGVDRLLARCGLALRKNVDRIIVAAPIGTSGGLAIYRGRFSAPSVIRCVAAGAPGSGLKARRLTLEGVTAVELSGTPQPVTLLAPAAGTLFAQEALAPAAHRELIRGVQTSIARTAAYRFVKKREGAGTALRVVYAALPTRGCKGGFRIWCRLMGSFALAVDAKGDGLRYRGLLGARTALARRQLKRLVPWMLGQMLGPGPELKKASAALSVATPTALGVTFDIHLDRRALARIDERERALKAKAARRRAARKAPGPVPRAVAPPRRVPRAVPRRPARPALRHRNPAAIRRVVLRHRAQVERCYHSSLRPGPRLVNLVRIRFRISAKGTVSGATVMHSTLRDPKAARCIRAVFTRMRFPPHGTETLVTYPVRFKPGGG